ncbi:hypothetical protein FLAG1_02560 [Fusarium langsethiae]|uniref:Uncharacterized protein n=1 Tax=Fusarium langsethiae TaxID=179993 RepID=A0A0M9F2D2_FUSLA|nr:hypothetical protein FLAG1_02560 [Fusarium langsethiae]
MTPKTRSGGVPAASRVYHSTPAQQQAHFPARKKVVRTYGKQNRKKQAETPSKLLRQQTLTQIDFVSSFEAHDDPIVLSDSEQDDMGSDKEGEENVEDEQQKPQDEDDEEPIPSGRKRRATAKKAPAKNDRTKRRRTLGDDTAEQPKPKKERKSSRRKTMGDAPSSSSNYYTQTLTQFLGRKSTPTELIKDSEDEDEDDEFQQWLGNPKSPSPKHVRKRKHVSPVKTPKILKSILKRRPEETLPQREESVVPQTPQKQTPGKRAKSVEIPSSSQLSAPPSISSTPASMMLERYGPADRVEASPVKGKMSSPAVPSPLKELKGKPRVATTPRKHERIIQDSYATDSWGSTGRTPLRELPVDSPNKTPRTPRGILEPLESSSGLDEMETPTKTRRGGSTELGGSQRSGSPTPRMKKVSPGSDKKRVMLEIPDSEGEDDEDFGEDENEDENENDENTFVAGAETQLIMSELASSEEEIMRASSSAHSTIVTTTKRQAFASITSEESSGLGGQGSSTSLPPLRSRNTELPPPSSTPKTRSRPAKRVRNPIHRPLPPTQTQPLESQRVPLATLQSLPPASARTDVLLPLSQDIIDDVLEGYQADLVLNFKIPAQVVRFWLFDGELLRFMACADPGRVTEGPAWRYHLTQVYELNNPVEGDDMQEEGWIDGDVDRYVYFPPAVVGQLLWNLRHAMFKEGASQDEPTQIIQDEDDSRRVDLFANSSQPVPEDKHPTPSANLSVSQQVEAQLKSDFASSTQFPPSDDILVPSTPDEESNDQQNTTPPTTRITSSPTTIKPPPRRTPRTASSRRASRPSLSSASKRPTVRPSQATTASQASTPEKQQSSSIHRPPLHSSSSIGLPESLLEGYDVDEALRLPPGYNPDSSQLLTKSQMLPDSLLRDDTRVPPEIWDSDEDDERL